MASAALGVCTRTSRVQKPFAADGHCELSRVSSGMIESDEDSGELKMRGLDISKISWENIMSFMLMSPNKSLAVMIIRGLL